MTKSDLIQTLSLKYPQLAARDVEAAVKAIVDHMADTLAGADGLKSAGLVAFPFDIAHLARDAIRKREARLN